MDIPGPIQESLIILSKDFQVMTREESIREAVLRGIALNRTPGLHFPGNLLGVSFERVSSEHSLLTLDADPHCLDADGQMNFGALALLADIAWAGTIRAMLERTTRLGTVSLSLQFSGAPWIGRLTASAQCDGFFQQGDLLVPVNKEKEEVNQFRSFNKQALIMPACPWVDTRCARWKPSSPWRTCATSALRASAWA